MSHPLWVLKAAIHARLAGDAELTGLLGGPRVFEEPPRGAQAPYVTFGEAVSRDWSDTSGAGHEHLLTMLVWSASPARSRRCAWPNGWRRCSTAQTSRSRAIDS